MVVVAGLVAPAMWEPLGAVAAAVRVVMVEAVLRLFASVF